MRRWEKGKDEEMGEREGGRDQEEIDPVRVTRSKMKQKDLIQRCYLQEELGDHRGREKRETSK